MDIIVSIFLQLALQLGIGATASAVTPNKVVLAVDCAVDGAYAEAERVARRAELATPPEHRKPVVVRCESSGPTIARGSDNSAP